MTQLPLFPPKVLACGGGLDSWAMLLERVEARERPDAVVFCDVGDPDGLDPAEWPGTYAHLREVVLPYCRRHRIPFHWLDSTRYPVRDARSLFAWLWERKQIPVTGPKRICTIVAKVERFERWLDEHYPDQVVEVWVGFEAGEEGRAANDPNAGRRKTRPGQATRVNRFPLIEAGLCRCLCAALCRRLGQPVPPKSACAFCPYGSKGDWQRFAAELPDHFARTVEMEDRKPPTARNGIKLSIMGYRAKKDPLTRAVLSVKAPPLPEFIRGIHRSRVTPCLVCGAPEREPKTVGCSYEDAA